MKATFAAAVFLAFGVAEAGQVIYDNQVTAIDGAYGSDAYDSDPVGPQFVADDFVLQVGANVIGDVHWTGVYLDNIASPTDSFTIQVFADDSGAPSALIRSIDIGSPTRSDTQLNLNGYDIYAYHVDIESLTLTAGSTYWLSIFNDMTDFNSASTNEQKIWAWSFQGGGNAMLFQQNADPAEWSRVGVKLDFRLTTVPEPATLALFGLGLAGLGAVRRRKGRQGNVR